jgi:hypothetical protein
MTDDATATLLLVQANRERMQWRIDRNLRLHNGDIKAAYEGAGIAIGIGFAEDIVQAFDRAEMAIKMLVAALRMPRETSS